MTDGSTTLPRSALHAALSTTDEILDEAKNRRMFILVDDEDRENEGDLIIPAQMVTPAAINFMATHARGLISLAMTQDRIDQLGISPMGSLNGGKSAFTISIEARDGVTTGISAADRARTIITAIDASKGPEAIVSPGHVFPIAARAGGVLVRAGHTEAAVDVSRLAGLNPSGVICPIMNDDGTMARLNDLIIFAQKHNLKIGTIRDLIAYRLRCDHNIEKLSEAPFHSEWGGEWIAMSFRNKAIGTENLALVKGRLSPGTPALVRIHSVDLFADLLAQSGAKTSMLRKAMQAIGEAGSGVVVVLSHTMPGEVTGSIDRLVSIRKDDGSERRDYGVGTQILAALGVHEMVLLTNSHRTHVGLDGFGLSIVEERAL